MFGSCSLVGEEVVAAVPCAALGWLSRCRFTLPLVNRLGIWRKHFSPRAYGRYTLPPPMAGHFSTAPCTDQKKLELPTSALRIWIANRANLDCKLENLSQNGYECAKYFMWCDCGKYSMWCDCGKYRLCDCGKYRLHASNDSRPIPL